jgi:magnesium transporter
MINPQNGSIQNKPGSAPGIEHDEIVGLQGTGGYVSITCTDYSPGKVSVQEIDDLEKFVGIHRPEWSAVRWINVAGLSDMNAIHALATKYDLHPLAVEDLLHTTQRPKVDSYGGDDESDFQARLFIVTRVLEIKDGHLAHHQVSIFVGHTTILTFQEMRGNEWNSILQRLKMKGSRLRNSDASFLAYSLLDAVMDSCFPILEHYSNRAEELEDVILENANPSVISEIHQLKRDLLTLRWVIWPMREVVASLQRDPHECISDNTRVYLRDLYDHVIQIIDIIETYRQIASDLTETYMSSVSNRMNEIMKVLTLIGTIFIPLTFLAGVYGMNFHYFPELDQVWAYPAFWVICFVLALIMLLLFRRRNWL